jgi:hypothetical protein
MEGGRAFSTVFVSLCWRPEISFISHWTVLSVTMEFLTAGQNCRNTIQSDFDSSYGTSMLIAG